MAWQGEGGLSFSPLVGPGLETLPQASACLATELEPMECECEVHRQSAKAPEMSVCPLKARDDKVLGGGTAIGWKELARESPCGGEPPAGAPAPDYRVGRKESSVASEPGNASAVGGNSQGSPVSVSC